MRKSRLKYLFFSLIFIALVSCMAMFSNRAKAPAIPRAEYAGTDSCVKPECHLQQYESVRGSVHKGLFDDDRFAQSACELCHGKCSQHVLDPKNPVLVLSFKRINPKEASEICINCHNTGSLDQWFNSRHYQSDISCNVCHQSHGLSADHLLKADDPQLCMDHHSKVKQEFDLQYKHKFVAASAEAQTAAAAAETPNPPAANNEAHPEPPVEPAGGDAKPAKPLKIKPPVTPPVTKCSTCHSPHENFNTNAKSKIVRGVCVGCHTKYAGPFEYPHKPAQQNCLACHVPHGSDNASLCKTAPAEVCLLKPCHSKKTVHPFYVYQQEPDLETFSQKCLKCHPLVHGSKFVMFRKFKPSGGPQVKGSNALPPQQGVQGPGGNLSNQ